MRIERTNSRIKTINKSCFALSCRIRGESLFFYGNGTHRVSRGDVIYIPAGSSYLQESPGEEIITFHLEAYSKMPPDICIFSPGDPEGMIALFLRAYREFTGTEPGGAHRATALLYEILSLGDLSSPEKQGTSPQFASALRQLQAEMYCRDFSVASLCRRSGMSRTYFNRLFRAELGTTPTEYVNRMRINKAILLLESGNYRNEEIATLCGFNDVKYFYTVFKRLTGRTTGSYSR